MSLEPARPHTVRLRHETVLAMEYLFLLARHGRHPRGPLWDEIRLKRPSTMSAYIRIILNGYRPQQVPPTKGRNPRLAVRATQEELDAWAAAASPLSRGAWMSMALELWCGLFTDVLDQLPPKIHASSIEDDVGDDGDVDDDGDGDAESAVPGPVVPEPQAAEPA